MPKDTSAASILAYRQAASEVYNSTQKSTTFGKENTIFTPNMAKFNDNLSSWIKEQSEPIKKAYALTTKNSAEQDVVNQAKDAYFKADSNVASGFIKSMQEKHAGVLTPKEIQDLSQGAVGQEFKQLLNTGASKDGAMGKKALDTLLERQAGLKDLLGEKNFRGLVKDVTDQNKTAAGQAAINAATRSNKPADELNMERAAVSLSLGLPHSAANEVVKEGRKFLGAKGMPAPQAQMVTQAITSPNGVGALKSAADQAQNSYSRGADNIAAGFKSGAIPRGAAQTANAGVTAAQDFAPQNVPDNQTASPDKQNWGGWSGPPGVDTKQDNFFPGMPSSPQPKTEEAPMQGFSDSPAQPVTAPVAKKDPIVDIKEMGWGK